MFARQMQADRTVYIATRTFKTRAGISRNIPARYRQAAKPARQSTTQQALTLLACLCWLLAAAQNQILPFGSTYWLEPRFTFVGYDCRSERTGASAIIRCFRTDYVIVIRDGLIISTTPTISFHGDFLFRDVRVLDLILFFVLISVSKVPSGQTLYTRWFLAKSLAKSFFPRHYSSWTIPKNNCTATK